MCKCLMWRAEMIRRSDLQSNPHVLFVFGDNMERTGFGGQAKEMRGEPNAVGIPTKHYPTNQRTAFFTDADFGLVRPAIDEAFVKLADHIKSGKPIVFPEDGIGTGRANLSASAPKIRLYIDRATARLAELAIAPD